MATSGSSRSTRCASAATSTASSSPPSRRSTESERNARETVNSFRRLTLDEIQAARPLRIKVINVQPGDTVESLSHRWPASIIQPSASECSTASTPTPRSSRATASRSWWIRCNLFGYFAFSLEEGDDVGAILRVLNLEEHLGAGTIASGPESHLSRFSSVHTIFEFFSAGE